jgi:hypothetical protein
MRALQELGHRITPVDTLPPDVMRRDVTLPSRIRRKLFGPWDAAGANASVLSRASSDQFDVLWLDKGLTIDADTLRRVKTMQPNCKIVGYSPDDMAGRHNQSRQFLQHLPLYDVYFTTKTYGVDELKALGCPRVEFVGNAYDPNIHRPMPVTAEDRDKLGGAVGFVGDHEDDRARSMKFLASNGIVVRVWGTRWERSVHSHPNLVVEHKGLWADDYAKAICAFDINLCFLRKINRDRQTQRTMEIPACGAFMLAERTEEHLDLFVEGKEAAFFSTDEELLEKVRYYMDHSAERRSIADAGLQRCLRNGYSNHDRLRWMLQRAVQP